MDVRLLIFAFICTLGFALIGGFVGLVIFLVKKK